MATNLLNNCHFDLTKITNLFLGNILFTGGTIQYPIEIQTLAGSVDSIIAYSDVNAGTVTIGGQEIILNEVDFIIGTIVFDEELIIDNLGKNYKKTIIFSLSGIDLSLVDQLDLYNLNENSKNIAILIDENEEYLIIGTDNPLMLDDISTALNGTENLITLTFSTTSKSRARDLDFQYIIPSVTPTIIPTATPIVTPSITPTITPTATPSITVTPTITPSVTITPTVTPSITPTVTPSITITPSITPTITPTATPSITVTPTITPSVTITPTVTPSITPTVTPSITITPSITPSVTCARPEGLEALGLMQTYSSITGTTYFSGTFEGACKAKYIWEQVNLGNPLYSGYSFGGYTDWVASETIGEALYPYVGTGCQLDTSVGYYLHFYGLGQAMIIQIGGGYIIDFPTCP